MMALGAELPAMAGFVVLIAGAAFGAAVEQVYGLDDDLMTGVALPLGVALALWLAFTGLLVGYVQLSGSFSGVYGPLTGVIALLLWAADLGRDLLRAGAGRPSGGAGRPVVAPQYVRPRLTRMLAAEPAL